MGLLELQAPSIFGGEDHVAVALKGREALNELFSFTVSALSPKETLTPNDVLGASVSVEIASGDDSPARLINGMVTAYRALGRNYASSYGYEFDLSPSFWLTTLNEDCRVFQAKTVSDIIKEVLTPYSKQIDYSLKVSASGKREYCVQYNESDYDFLRRLLAEEGYYFFVKHVEQSSSSFRQQLVIADAPSGYFQSAQSPVEFTGVAVREASLALWRSQHRAHALEWRLADYDYTRATEKPSGVVQTNKDYSPYSKKRYGWHGRFAVKQAGDELAKNRILAEDCLNLSFAGEGRYPHFAPGATFSFRDPPDDLETGDSVVVWVEHEASDFSTVAGHMDTEDGAIEPPSYENRFVCARSATPVVPPEPPSYTPMKGLQTGVVVGPEGEEIHTDEYGRIQVRFHWDRYNAGSPSPTCWMRVAQTFAGNKFGAQFIPRIGMEVLVDFIEGDPDRPIVVGAVYNSANKPPFETPGKKTQSGWRTQSSLGGKKINELRFEDKAGSEEVYFHAGKDFTRHVANNDDLKVDNKQTRSIKADRTVKILEGSDSLTIDKGSSSTQLKMGDISVKADQGGYAMALMTDYKLDIKAGNQITNVKAGYSSLKAMQKIELKVGASSLTLDPAGVTIKAPMIKIQATAMAEISAPMVKAKAQGMATLEASGLTKVEASGMLMLKGGIVMIN